MLKIIEIIIQYYKKKQIKARLKGDYADCLRTEGAINALRLVKSYLRDEYCEHVDYKIKSVCNQKQHGPNENNEHDGVIKSKEIGIIVKNAITPWTKFVD